jgi:hypothetical protein
MAGIWAHGWVQVSRSLVTPTVCCLDCQCYKYDADSEGSCLPLADSFSFYGISGLFGKIIGTQVILPWTEKYMKVATRCDIDPIALL